MTYHLKFSGLVEAAMTLHSIRFFDFMHIGNLPIKVEYVKFKFIN